MTVGPQTGEIKHTVMAERIGLNMRGEGVQRKIHGYERAQLEHRSVQGKARATDRRQTSAMNST